MSELKLALGLLAGVVLLSLLFRFMEARVQIMTSPLVSPFQSHVYFPTMSKAEAPWTERMKSLIEGVLE